MAANQVGKTLCAAAESALHLTGLYPPWWPGRRWDRPVRGWAAGETGETTRDTVQRYLMGPPAQREEWGTGWIPGRLLGDVSPQGGISDAIDTVLVKHVSGGWSELGFRSYGRGRRKWQAATLDFVWFDEEPPWDVYSEGITRTNATGGSVVVTFTPLLGLSEVVLEFLADNESLLQQFTQ